MGNYSVPEEIRKLKPVGTNVKKIKNQFYVYSHSQIKDSVTGKWKTATGKLLGKIIPGVGFIPRDTVFKNHDKISVYQYGEYLLAGRLCIDDIELLKQCINPEVAYQLFALACIFRFEGYIGFVPAEQLYCRTLIARDYPALKFTYHRLSNLLANFGRSEAMLEFQRKCMALADTIAVDGHVIPSDNTQTDLSFNGYKVNECKGEQMNLLVALDVKTSLPLATRVFPGYMVDKSDFKEFMNLIGNAENKLLIMDSGFYSEENIRYMAEHKIDYIMPLSINLCSYKESTKSFKGRMSQFIYTNNKKSDLVEYREIKEINGRRTILFKNVSEKEKLLKEYVKKMEEGSKRHTQEGLKKGEKTFGIIVLETSLSKDKINAKEVYNYYKNRWAIETYYDRIKNTVNFKELNLTEYGVVQGIAFVMLLAGRIDQRIMKAAKKVKKNSSDLVRLMKALKLYDNGRSTEICNIKKEHLQIAEILGFSYNTEMKCLNPCT